MSREVDFSSKTWSAFAMKRSNKYENRLQTPAQLTYLSLNTPSQSLTEPIRHGQLALHVKQLKLLRVLLWDDPSRIAGRYRPYPNTYFNIVT